MALDETLNCPACKFSSDVFFGECPKCGVVVKKFYEKQRERQSRERQAQEVERVRMRQNAVQQEKKKEINEKVKSGMKVGAKGLKYGLLVGFGMFSVGLVVCVIPVIGWVVGPLLMLGGLFSPFMFGAFGIKGGIDMAGSSVLQGACPYCTGRVDVTVLATQKGQIVGVDCPICKKRFVVKGQSFCAV